MKTNIIKKSQNVTPETYSLRKATGDKGWGNDRKFKLEKRKDEEGNGSPEIRVGWKRNIFKIEIRNWIADDSVDAFPESQTKSN